jgi:mitochondrial fission protein ELM1
VLLGDKAGDNAQCLALAEALGWPFEIRKLRWRPVYWVSNHLLGASRLTLDHRRSDRLDPPWPDLVIAIGRRSVPVARWVRWQSGGRAKLVQIGRPQAPLGLFDLVVTTPQYRLPAGSNVLHLSRPLHLVRQERLAEEGEAWRRRLAHLPRPWIALFVGGPTSHLRLPASVAGEIARLVDDAAVKRGGSVLVSTSRRTPPQAAEAIEQAIRAPHHLHLWRPVPHDNPFVAYLALADEFFVTGDSASMLSEACATGKPVTILPLPVVHGVVGLTTRAIHAGIAAIAGEGRAERIVGHLSALGLVRLRRDLARLHLAVLERGLARLPGTTPGVAPIPALDERALAADRVRRLFVPTRGGRASLPSFGNSAYGEPAA